MEEAIKSVMTKALDLVDEARSIGVEGADRFQVYYNSVYGEPTISDGSFRYTIAGIRLLIQNEKERKC